MATQMTKSQLIEKISSESELPKKDVKGVLETLATIGYKELKKTGVFLVPGFAKFVVIKKPATKARQGTNPFSGEPMMFKAKPAPVALRGSFPLCLVSGRLRPLPFCVRRFPGIRQRPTPSAAHGSRSSLQARYFPSHALLRWDHREFTIG